MSSLNKIIPLLFFLALSSASCTKDLCRDTLCINGGQCLDGTCNCAPGYSGKHCDNYDLCYNVTCPGTCEFGECLPPEKAFITKIEVLRFPSFKAGNFPWDQEMPPNNLPDIFFHLIKDSVLAWVSPVLQYNASPNTVYAFTLNPPFEINNASSSWAIGLMESDVPQQPEAMDVKLSFNLLQQGGNYPPVITLDNGGPTAFRITATYEW